MAIDWDALYELAPSDTTYVKDTDDSIRSLKTATRERITKEHEFDLASQARQGLHRAGSAVAFYQASAPTQRNGVALAVEDAGIKWINSTTFDEAVWTGTAWKSISAPVIGACYWQLPGRAAPASLWVGTTWSNISSSFAGDFFRAEGGNASTFESGEQAHAVENHAHSHTHNLYREGGTPTSSQLRPTTNYTPGYDSLSNVISTDASGMSSGNVAAETRPVNKTVRIWVRTA